ncbi:preprotein translocase subunit SecG [Bartonella grahamii]|uniref:Protein-export membrane protein SecG n=2 Tax=Bartonella grahamii TaxID=33045 RepID=A0A336NFZ0_BARGR|nr:preprotein translocase subunit SecG [Bartonella grahamii]ACS50966.1 preprotein translocase SecG subunit [Bartonella grahamii as4aup]SSZ40606.1 Preprotein translocase band 1 subunit [Bartonella grahamii]
MQTVLIVIHLLIVITLVGVILIQPSEGGGLGVSNSSGLMKTRGSRNPLTRLTAILACCFFVVSIGLTVVGNISNSSSDILKRIPVNSEQNSTNKGSESVPSSDGESSPSILEQLGGNSNSPQEQKQSTNPEAESPVPPVLENTVPDNSTK